MILSLSRPPPAAGAHRIATTCDKTVSFFERLNLPVDDDVELCSLMLAPRRTGYDLYRDTRPCLRDDRAPVALEIDCTPTSRNGPNTACGRSHVA